MIFIYRTIRAPWPARLCASSLTIILIVLAVPWLRNGFMDAYVPYSGVVVERGAEWHWLADGLNWYLILEDAQGRRRKRYVSASGYAYSHVGDFVVKRRGFAEFPHRPGDPVRSLPRKRN